MRTSNHQGAARALSIATRVISAAIPDHLSERDIRLAFDLPASKAPFWIQVVTRVGQATVRASARAGHCADDQGLNVVVGSLASILVSGKVG